MSQSSRHVVAAPRRANAESGRMTSMMMADGNVQRRCSSKPLSAADQMRGGNLSFCFDVAFSSFCMHFTLTNRCP